MSLTDARRMWKLADERGTAGLHSHDARRLGITGNPSQRAKDIADHVAFWTKREARGKRPGSLYFTDGNQPSDAVAVRPNRGSEIGDGSNGPPGVGSAQPVTDLSITPASEEVAAKEPVAIVRDYTDPRGKWMEIPVSQLAEVLP